ncbi:hypothetical protein AMEX_G27435 [Astyanax mexicanus]|uniref:SET domain-containing protein n=1 Tax=Astyanax mexicanus TaxID=7994 RepID=A0A8T2KS36_ASTMX|nr:hypothetical protein AMEX_G27435 [Astyanax mexicanus]
MASSADSNASPEMSRNRTHLMCPFCKTTHYSLPEHLRKCMNGRPPAEQKSVLEEAKKNAHRLLKEGRRIEYGIIRRILDSDDPEENLIQELETRGIVVYNIPPHHPDSAASAASSVAPSAGPDESDFPPIKPEPDSSGEYFQESTSATQKTSLREKMASAGLYFKHSTAHPLLKSFAHYLEVDLENDNFTQEVENVARFMYFMDPKQPSLLFVCQTERTREYFNTLSEVGLSKQTVHNYIKSVKRFLKFHISSTDMELTDLQLYNDCQLYTVLLSDIQAAITKQFNKEATRKEFPILTEGSLQPKDCWAVLEAANKDFLAVIAKLTGPRHVRGHHLTLPESQLVLYYLEAVLILRHLHRPGVVEHMTVKDWMIRKPFHGKGGHVVVRVLDHKTATQVATFALTLEEEMWFDTYYTEVRPTTKAKRKKTNEGEDDDKEPERFFISSTGNPIYNASNDLERLHKKYNLPKVNSQMARRVFETATKHMPDAQRSMVADYLMHSSSSAERRNRMQMDSNVVEASLLLQSVATSDSDGEEGRQHPGGRCLKMDEQQAYDLLLQSYPVTLDSAPPKRSERVSVAKEHDRHCYDRWRGDQKQLRVQHVLDHFGRRQPSESRVRSWIEKQGWTANVPDAALVVKAWKPSGRVDTAMESHSMQKCIKKQKWKGLVAVPEEGKGRGVVATRAFQIGEVVCDYHGKVVSRKVGIETHKSTIGMESGYMFFYTDKNDQSKCVDAHLEECECHPGKQTIGRLINHSSKRANVRPRLYSLDDRDVILFIAQKGIKVNEEILYNYGASKKSFAGEGLDLDWL